MLLLRMVSLIEYEEIDLLHLNEAAVETVEEELGCADENHAFAESLVPESLCPHDAGHFSMELVNRVLQVGFQDAVLLEAEGNLFDEEECHLFGLSLSTPLKLLIQGVPQQESSNERFASAWRSRDGQ